MQSNLTDTPRDPQDLRAEDYDEASLKILRVLDRRAKANSYVIRRESGLPKHKVEQRIRSDGILVRAGLVELVGYDEDTNFAHAPKVMSLTQYARDAIYHGFFDKDEDETAQVVLDEEQFVEFESTLSAFEAQLEAVHSDVENLEETYGRLSDFLLEDIYYELAMLRYVVAELNVPKEVMKEKAAEFERLDKSGVDLKEKFYSDETSS